MLYPRLIEEVEIEKLNELKVASAIIEEVEINGLTKAQAIGPVLNGSDDIETFNEVWDKLFEESKNLKSVEVSGTETSYKFNLSEVANYLNSDTFYSKYKEERNVSTWTDFKDSFEVV